jgi:aminocarboxymuconate-semialdehyde decarboxylase
MLNRRGFLRHAAAVTTGCICVGCGLRHAAAQVAPRREINIAGRRVRTVDVHAHCAVPAVLDLVNGTPFERPAKQHLRVISASRSRRRASPT